MDNNPLDASLLEPPSSRDPPLPPGHSTPAWLLGHSAATFPRRSHQQQQSQQTQQPGPAPRPLTRKCLSMHDFKMHDGAVKSVAWPVPTRTTHKKRPMRWLVLHDRGDRQVLTLDKRHMLQTFNLDIPMRDLRLLDSQFFNYETIGQISVRENAIVFSMEQVKACIMADKVIIPLEEESNEAKSKFISYLENSIQDRAAQLQASLSQANGGDDDKVGGIKGLMQQVGGKDEALHDKEVLPFELHVLEAALGEICNLLAREVDFLQAQAQPALEELTRNADQPTLERVRRIKTGHQRLLGRCKLVSEQLERLMEDDGDMLRMCLTRQVLLRAATSGSAGAAAALGRACSAGPSPQPPPYLNHPHPQQHPQQQLQQREQDGDAQRSAQMRVSLDSLDLPVFASPPCADGFGVLPQVAETPTGVGSPAPPPLLPGLGSNSAAAMQHSLSRASLGLQRRAANAAAAETLDDDKVHGLLDVENLLESYFVLVDSTQQRLVSLGEYIDDYEDLINLQLDYSRNKLIRFDIVLTTGTFALAIFNAVAGMLGENLRLPEVITADLWGFTLINLSMLCVCACAFFLIIRQLIASKII